MPGTPVLLGNTVKTGGFRALVALALPAISGGFRGQVLRFMQRRCGFVPALQRCLEVLFPQLQVVLLGNRRAVPNPFADYVHGEALGQFGFAGAPHVLKQLRPLLQPGVGNQTAEAGTPVYARIAVPGDSEHVAGRRTLGKRRVKVWPQFREQGNHANVAPFKVLQLRLVHGNPAALKVHIGPAQRQYLRGAPQTAEASQCQDEPELCIRLLIHHRRELFPRDKVEPGRVAADVAPLIGERVLPDQALADGRAEELLTAPHDPLGRVLRQLPRSHHPAQELIGIAGGDLIQSVRRPLLWLAGIPAAGLDSLCLCLCQIRNQILPRLPQIRHRERLGVGTAGNVLVYKRRDGRNTGGDGLGLGIGAGLGNADARQLIPPLVIEPFKPALQISLGVLPQAFQVNQPLCIVGKLFDLPGLQFAGKPDGMPLAAVAQLHNRGALVVCSDARHSVTSIADITFLEHSPQVTNRPPSNGRDRS